MVLNSPQRTGEPFLVISRPNMAVVAQLRGGGLVLLFVCTCPPRSLAPASFSFRPSLAGVLFLGE